MEFCKVTLTIESADEILKCDHSNESSLLVLSHGAICFSKLHKMKFGHFVKISFQLNLAVMGLNLLPGYSGTSRGKGGEEGSCPFPQIRHQLLSSELHGMKLEFLSLNNKSAYLVEFIGSLCVMIT